MYKNSIKKFTFFSLGIYFSLLFLIFIIDPYNEFCLFKLNIKKFTNKYSSVATLYNKLDNERYTLIFGTSRSQKINNNMLEGDKLLNFGMIYGNPSTVKNVLSGFSNKQKENIKEIYYLIDIHTINKDRFYIASISTNIYENIISLIGNLSFDYILNLFKVVINNTAGSNYYVKCNGVLVNDNDIKTDNFIKEAIKNKSHKEIDQYFKYDQFSILKLQEIKYWADKNNIKIIFFTSTFHNEYLDKIDRRKFNMFQSSLSSYIEYKNLFYIQGISNKYGCFSDATHLTTECLKKVFLSNIKDIKENQ